MSIKDRLAKKTGDLVSTLPSTAKPKALAEELQPAESRVPRTGPGQMLAYRSHMQENNQKVQDLEDKLKAFEDSLPMRLLDPKSIGPSKWANRHGTSFNSPEFESLKSEIESSGGNVQPIRVRPVGGNEGRFEIIYGHRRHQACLQLGMSVSAVIESVGDKDLFIAMDRENRVREDLSPFEQGEMYRRALDDGLFPSLRKMSDELGVDPGNASKAIAIARLPSQVIEAFETPNQIQYRWGQELTAAILKDPEGVIQRAKAIRFSAKPLPPSDAMDRLLGKAKPIKPVSYDVKKKGKTVGKFIRKSDGSVNFALNAGVLSEKSFDVLRTSLQRLIDEL